MGQKYGPRTGGRTLMLTTISKGCMHKATRWCCALTTAVCLTQLCLKSTRSPWQSSTLQGLALAAVDYTFASEAEKSELRARMAAQMNTTASVPVANFNSANLRFRQPRFRVTASVTFNSVRKLRISRPGSRPPCTARSLHRSRRASYNPSSLRSPVRWLSLHLLPWGCEAELDRSKPNRPEGWKPQPGQVQHRLLRSAWSKRFEAPVRGLMWCPKLDQATPSDIGKWVDRDCNAALNLQSPYVMSIRAVLSKWILSAN
ncbi:hypothetical protein HaLaN_25212 [Haematococcus lacustris]|uniref:Uncharacterized protein n=1 Tax=Haematococcus lacustris TaxID=44745 RepID=A0A6A0A2B4_HAELA|nr:hypothetical protein HaLaN_25212 [Haematococcus lacustris]